MTTPTTPDTSPAAEADAPDVPLAGPREIARAVGTIGAFFVALIAAAGVISVADSGDPLAGGLAVIAALGAFAVAVSAYRDLFNRGRRAALARRAR